MVRGLVREASCSVSAGRQRTLRDRDTECRIPYMFLQLCVTFRDNLGGIFLGTGDALSDN